jgi:flagellar export protein FliJ
MAFHFPLQALLHFRKSLEHQQKLRLRAANQQVARARHLIEQMEGRRQQLVAMQARELSSGVTSAELRFGILSETELIQHRMVLEQELARLEQWREQQRAIFQQARRARETLESIRDQQFALYRKEAARREQRAQDDLFLFRREYLRRS